MMRVLLSAMACLAALIAITGQVHAGAIVSGFDALTLSASDDGSDGPVAIGFDSNFFGTTYDQLYVNNNGNVTFGNGLNTYTPAGLGSISTPIIAPFFADVDTRDASDPVTYGHGSFEGRDAFGVNWVNVNYYDSTTTHANRNSFQLILVDRSNIGAGDFDIIFNYDQILWETGQDSDGDENGLGGSSARVGYSNGQLGPLKMFVELEGSGAPGAFVNGGSHALISNRLNSNVDGRYIFNVRNGEVTADPSVVPEPTSLALLGIGACVAGLGAARRRRMDKLGQATA